MGREIVYCEKCGARILQEEFDRGHAITVRNQNYCPKCRDSVAPAPPTPPAPPPAETDARPLPVDHGKGSSALRRAIRVPATVSPPMRSGPSGSRHPAVRPPAGPRGAARGAAERSSANPSSNKTVGIVIAVVIAVVLLLMLLMSGGEPERRPRRTGAVGGEERPTPPPSKDPQVELGRLQSQVDALLGEGKSREARAAVTAYQERFPGTNGDAIRKMVEQINWKEQ